MRAGSEVGDLDPARLHEMTRIRRLASPGRGHDARFGAIDFAEHRSGDDDDLGGGLEQRPCPLGERSELFAIAGRQARIGRAGFEIVVGDVDDAADAALLQAIEIGRRGVAADDAGPADRIDVRREIADRGQLHRTPAARKMAHRVEEIEVGRGDAFEGLVESARGKKHHLPIAPLTRPSAPSSELAGRIGEAGCSRRGSRLDQPLLRQAQS